MRRDVGKSNPTYMRAVDIEAQPGEVGIWIRMGNAPNITSARQKVVEASDAAIVDTKCRGVLRAGL